MLAAILIALALPGAPALAQDDPLAALAAAEQRLESIRARAGLEQDARDIERLINAYGFYYDRALWDEMADLFAADGTIELGRRGVYVGQERVRAFLHSLGPEGPRWGALADHMEVQAVVNVAEDGRTAKARSRELVMAGVYGESATLGDAIYENAFVKEDGVWKFSSVRLYPIFTIDYEQGWAQSAIQSPGPSETLPPDRPPTSEFGEYPTYFAPPFHYPNPATGAPVQYREEGE